MDHVILLAENRTTFVAICGFRHYLGKGGTGLGYLFAPRRMNQSLFINQRLTRSSLNKVPAITAYFWVLKLLTTAMGEATSDYLVHHLNPYLAVGLGFMGFVVAFVWQWQAPRYIAPIYWFLVLMVAIFGTMVADSVHVALGVPYYLSSSVFAVVLAVVFRTWYKTEKTVSIHRINTKRRELFYWAAVLATFAMGTATGDMTATTLHLGYLPSGLLFLALFGLTGVAYVLGFNTIWVFWVAYVLTRPLGASFADWTAKPPSMTGLGYGDGVVSAVLGIALIVGVGYLAITQRDVQQD